MFIKGMEVFSVFIKSTKEIFEIEDKIDYKIEPGIIEKRY